jgi:hypothetical protein
MTHLDRTRSRSGGIRTPSASAADWAVLVGSAALAPLVVRFALLVEAAIVPAGADARGALADAAACLVVVGALAALSRWPGIGRWAGAILTVVWSLAHFANYEHIRELGSVVEFTYAGYVLDEAFLRGSVLAPTRPVLVLSTTAVATVLAVVALGARRRYPAWPPTLAGIALLALLALFPRSSAAATWRQVDLVSEQIRRFSRGPVSEGAGDPASLPDLATRDLSGQAIIAAETRAQNVLLVILEGVSGAYLPSLREPHGYSSPITMPRLDRIARRGISYSNFIATQRQTNRGEFAILCGEYPKLITAEAKMTERAGRGPIDCLPAALHEAGFSTTYLQAAPLAFMMKDQFMAQAGFERVLGDDWFTSAINRNHWGVDDRTFLQAGADLAGELDRASEPWFLTLLTVGTHHRYNVPPDFECDAEPGSAAWAFTYLDLAVGEFVARLEESGVMEDTLVLITSDESQASEDGASDARNLLTHGWGFLIALLPSAETELVGQVFAQPDVPISVLDYLRLDSTRPHWTGRSVFRRYDGGRNVYWGNTYLGMVAGLSPELDLTICTESFADCRVAQTEEGGLLKPLGPMRPATTAEAARLERAAQRSLATDIDNRGRRRVVLISGEHPVIRTSGQQYVFGGQFLTLPPHSATDVELVVTLKGRSGWVEFAHNFLVGLRPRHVWSERLEVGQTLELRYRVGAESILEMVECRLWITAFEGDDLALEFQRATLDIHPLPASSPPVESTVLAFEISR